jgi:hypothetical protein
MFRTLGPRTPRGSTLWIVSKSPSALWFYVDVNGREHGCFSSHQMQTRFDQGEFKGVDMLVRASNWLAHKPLFAIWGDDDASYFAVTTSYAELDQQFAELLAQNNPRANRKRK